jgi:hypothetical protein
MHIAAQPVMHMKVRPNDDSTLHYLFQVGK